MFHRSAIRPGVRHLGWVTSAALAVALGACSSISIPGSKSAAPAGNDTFAAPISPVTSSPLGGSDAVAADHIGNGPVKVALILPLTQGSGPSVVGASLRNAAELALSEAGSNDITLLIKDDRSTPEGARDAAQAALNEGADLFIGPLYAGDVREVGRIARGAGKSVIAFSTDTSAAAPGVYLLSFLVENYVDRIVDFAAARNKKSIAALIPDNDYGRVAEAEFQQVAARRNLRVLSIEHYTPSTLGAAVGKVAGLGDQIDTLFIPEQADAMPAMSQALTSAGLDTRKVQILGTGIWNDARVLKLPALQGAWFSAPENAGFNAFADRYRTKYSTDPTRIATLSYDAVSLAAALARTQGAARYTDTTLLANSGFNGADGVFRFKNNGTNERGLAVLQIKDGSTTALSAAPRNFKGSSAT
jgi:branched-chain amino acid transport system substrate-binding protein